MTDEVHLYTIRLTAKSLTQNFGFAGSEDFRSRSLEKPETVFQAMLKKETFREFDPRNLKGTVYSLKNRSIISRWIRDVCVAFNLKATTMCLAVQLTDRFVLANLTALALNQCQLAAITCIWIAAKFEELDAMLPSLKALVEVCDGAYKAEQILDLEERILTFFEWRVPHTTVNNYLYLYLHLLTDSRFFPEVTKGPTPTDDRMTLKLLKPGAASEVLGRAQMRVVTVVASYNQPLAVAIPLMCNSLGVTSVKGTLDCYRVAGDDVVQAKRLDQTLSPAQLGLQVGETVFIASSAASAVFTERDQIVLLRPLNTLMLHLCETLLQQTLLHPEFLRVAPHLSAMAVLILTRCLLSPNPESFQTWANYVCKTLNISRTNTVAICDVLIDKYRSVIDSDPSSLVSPIVPVPQDIKDRLLLAFGRRE